MRIKLDENLPRSAANVLAERGHDVDTVTAEDLSGARDADIVGAAARTARLLLTLDRRLADIRRYPPGSHTGIVVLRPTTQSAAAVRAVVTGLAASSQLESLASSRSPSPVSSGFGAPDISLTFVCETGSADWADDHDGRVSESVDRRGGSPRWCVSDGTVLGERRSG